MSQELCARIGCAEEATAVLLISSDCEAVVTDNPDSIATGMGVWLCNGHADRLVVPRGWEHRDERSTAAPQPSPELSEDLSEPDTPDPQIKGEVLPLLGKAFRAAGLD